MVAMKQSPEEGTEKGPPRHFSGVTVLIAAFVLGVTGVIGYTGYGMFKNQSLIPRFLVPHLPPGQSHVVRTEPLPKSLPSDVRLTREGIDHLLGALDEAVRRKDVDGVLRHIAHDATITIHLKQGPQQQMAVLTREEYRKTLGMSFSFPSANDFTRTTTSVSLASDERSAKVSFKSTETLRQANREFKTEGEETLVFHIRDGKPMITSLEQTFPGDST
ncbi:MAG: hypothetical protein A4E19_10435 [Nitrospira sp. SG-bin1]|nr:MAG: hypothetical protein A4E19_10435 [Nitrospira sp. SG-bin1]